VWLLFSFNLLGKIAAVLAWRTSPGLALALWLTPDFLLAYHLFMPHAQGLVRSPRRFATRANEVWLTLDDGPDPHDTPQILELLAAHQARATFFVIGQNALAQPDLVRAILAGGHEVAHHTHTHPLASFWCAFPARLASELDAALAALRSLGVEPTRFRPPASLKNPLLASALRKRSLTCVGWTARGLERSCAQADEVVQRVLRNLAPGNILLLHEGPRVPATIRVEAIRRVLAELQRQGYRCVIPTPAQLAGHRHR
jgi:peptidoglycan/xylan/chitin deacetylase (PgdA/CDA1 family)